MPIVLLPVPVRQKLCEHLDPLNKWRDLAKFVGLYAHDVQYIESQCSRGHSPTNEFLNVYGGQYNHSVQTLFALFQKNKLRNAMLIIKDHVDAKLHKYIPKIEEISEQLAPPITRSNNNTTSPGDVDDSHNTNSLESPGDIRVSSVIRVAESLLKIDYDELVEATGNWSPENKLGHGGFGEVFKGNFKNSDVAIKAMNYKHEHVNKGQVDLQQSYNELKYLNTLRHDNILAVYGYSINGEKPCLVYQLMKGGSLDSRLRTHSSRPPLTWQQRMSIALGTATGICFLHTARKSKPLIHGDIKPANILLDHCLQPKIGDFGLAREGPKSINGVTEVEKLFGTKIYLPPEFLSSKKLSTGVDIYSFGVVLLEMFTGRLMAECKLESEQIRLLKSVKERCQQSLKNRFDIFDNHLVTPMGEELNGCLCAIEVGVKCVEPNSKNRPSMNDVVKQFKPFSTEF